MIVIDTSALVAILQGEPEAPACRSSLDADAERSLSAVTLAEALIVAERRGFGSQMVRLIEGLRMEVAPTTEPRARAAATAYARWGKGAHPARLNLADCFAYALARERGAPLLYVGADFAQTDVASALPGAA